MRWFAALALVLAACGVASAQAQAPSECPSGSTLVVVDADDLVACVVDCGDPMSIVVRQFNPDGTVTDTGATCGPDPVVEPEPVDVVDVIEATPTATG